MGVTLGDTAKNPYSLIGGEGDAPGAEPASEPGQGR
jgi:hypothetical protein